MDDYTKICSKCGKAKPASGYHKQSSHKDGLQNYCKQCFREYAQENKHQLADTQMRYRARHPERIRENAKLQREKHRDKRRAYNREYHLKNKKRIHQRQKEWREQNPAYWNRIGENSKPEPDFSGEFIDDVKREVVWWRDDGICHICGEQTDIDDFEIDHIVPILRGGDHSYENVAVSHKKCNTIKGYKTPDEILAVDSFSSWN